MILLMITSFHEKIAALGAIAGTSTSMLILTGGKIAFESQIHIEYYRLFRKY